MPQDGGTEGDSKQAMRPPQTAAGMRVMFWAIVAFAVLCGALVAWVKVG